MVSNNIFDEVSDAGLVHQLVGQVGSLVHRSADGTLALRRIEGWVAVPKESQLFLGHIDQERLEAFCREKGYSSLYAVALEQDPRREDSPVCRVSASMSGLARFNRECSGVNYALCLADVSAVVICSTDEILVFAGPPEFTQAVVGQSLAQAAAEFREFATAPHWREQDRALYLSVLEALTTDYPRARAGEIVAFL